jgi:hypothetical protein
MPTNEPPEHRERERRLRYVPGSRCLVAARAGEMDTLIGANGAASRRFSSDRRPDTPPPGTVSLDAGHLHTPPCSGRDGLALVPEDGSSSAP